MINQGFNIVLVEPQIPQNTGNIVRLCACTNSNLYLVGKLGFLLTDKYLKRAGLDYWNDINIKQFSKLEELETEFKDNNFYYLTTKVTDKYTDIKFVQNDFIVFGSETKGLSENLLKNNPNKCYTIPMANGQRSLNLSNSAAIVLYEAIRQVKI